MKISTKIFDISFSDKVFEFISRKDAKSAKLPCFRYNYLLLFFSLSFLLRALCLSARHLWLQQSFSVYFSSMLPTFLFRKQSLDLPFILCVLCVFARDFVTLSACRFFTASP